MSHGYLVPVIVAGTLSRRAGIALGRSALNRSGYDMTRTFRPRFSLRALFVIITFASVGLALYENRIGSRHRAVLEVLGGNGSVRYVDQRYGFCFGGPPEPSITLGSYRRWFDFSRVVDCAECQSATDHTCSLLGQVETLTSICLSDSQVTDDGIAELSRLADLRDLAVDGTRVTDLGVSHLATLGKLESLSLANTTVTDGGVRMLQSCKSLTALDLSGTKISDVALGYLSDMPNLAVIELLDTDTSPGLADELQKALPNSVVVFGSSADEE